MSNNKGWFCPTPEDLIPGQYETYDTYAEETESRLLAELRESKDALAAAEADLEKARNALDQLEGDYSDMVDDYWEMSVSFADTIGELEGADARGDRLSMYLTIMAGVAFSLLAYILLAISAG